MTQGGSEGGGGGEGEEGGTTIHACFLAKCNFSTRYKNTL